MRLLPCTITTLIRVADLVSRLVFRVQQFLTGILPALLQPHELTGLIRTHYDESYRNVAAHHPETAYKWMLEHWEEDVIAHQKITSGTILVLGAGVGRESIALAHREFLVVGLDINRESLCVASQQARTRSLSVLFAQADFLALPIGPARVDCIFMSGIMYSSIPGRRKRQTWLRNLRTCLKDHGLIVLNFLVAREINTTPHRLIHGLNCWLKTLPGANRSYQLGDTCFQNHFLHAFVDEEEIRSELHEAGATINRIHWHEGNAVLSWPS